MTEKIITRLNILTVFLSSLVISLINANFKALGFADAAEFALVNELMGIAHAPGFPAYVLISKLFTSLFSILGITHITGLVLFSSLCMSLAAVLLYLSVIILLKNTYSQLTNTTLYLIAICSAIAPVSGTTLWHWSHSVEVYSLQILSIAILFYGLFRRETGDLKTGSYLTAIGLGIGLANHHLTSIMFIPVMILLWPQGWLVNTSIKKKKEEIEKINWGERCGKEAKFVIFITTGILLLFYGWMYVRASAELPFAFGSPNTFDRLFYHLSGGAWIKNTQATVKGIVGMRLPYFLRISFEQFFLFLIFILMGIIYLISAKKHRLWAGITFYYIFLLIYQLRIDQTADTDAYLCTPFFLMGIFAALGMARLSTWHPKVSLLIPVLLLIQIGVNYPKTTLDNFDVSTSFMNDLDKSIEKGSVVLIADWTNVINYNYARLKTGFRSDLCVLNYDLKFTHYDLFRRNNPTIYASVKPAYDRYITLLKKYHPQEIYNTGCTLDQSDLLQAYLQVVRELQSYCTKNNLAFVTDPKAFVFLSQQNVFPNPHISGSYVSSKEGIGNDDFLQFNHKWLSNYHAQWDPSAADKLVDLEAALDFQRGNWKQLGDTKRESLAENNYRLIKRQQNQMKKKMKFLFRRPT
ncbi:MAG: DUF2723 domain-containing protein [Bacteroidetes bacterium]|nr:DUF2723 domain-containing protein [Bacteroidota bacterium]